MLALQISLVLALLYGAVVTLMYTATASRLRIIERRYSTVLDTVMELPDELDMEDDEDEQWNVNDKTLSLAVKELQSPSGS